MYAVIENSGRQYKVAIGDIINIDKIANEPQATIIFDKVLLLAKDKDIKIGAPYLKEQVTGTIIKHGKHKKIEILKFKRRKHHMKRMGHRQEYTTVKITEIAAKQALPKEAKSSEPKEAQTTSEE